jgi:hypothetical protein
VPELSRFFGIIIRMFAEAGSQRSQVRYPSGSAAWWKHGRSYIKLS